MWTIFEINVWFILENDFISITITIRYHPVYDERFPRVVNLDYELMEKNCKVYRYYEVFNENRLKLLSASMNSSLDVASMGNTRLAFRGINEQTFVWANSNSWTNFESETENCACHVYMYETLQKMYIYIFFSKINFRVWTSASHVWWLFQVFYAFGVSVGWRQGNDRGLESECRRFTPPKSPSGAGLQRLQRWLKLSPSHRRPL